MLLLLHTQMIQLLAVGGPVITGPLESCFLELSSTETLGAFFTICLAATTFAQSLYINRKIHV